MLRAAVERSRSCAGKLRAAGIDLAAYNVQESADDLADLRRALGVPKLSLCSTSYGTQRALTQYGYPKDAILSPALATTLAKNIQARFLVSSTLMRTGYAATKTISFCGLALAQAFAGFPPGGWAARSAPALLRAMQVVAWVAVVFCVFRGLPVIIRSLKRYWSTSAPADAG